MTDYTPSHEAVTAALAVEVDGWDADVPESARTIITRALTAAVPLELQRERERIKEALDDALADELAILPGLRRALAAALPTEEGS